MLQQINWMPKAGSLNLAFRVSTFTDWYNDIIALVQLKELLQVFNSLILARLWNVGNEMRSINEVYYYDLMALSTSLSHHTWAQSRAAASSDSSWITKKPTENVGSIDIFTLVKMFQGRDITSHSNNAGQSAGSSPSFFSCFSILPHLYWSPQLPSALCLSKMCQKVAGDMRHLLGSAEDLITPQWQCWLAQVLILSTIVPQIAFGLPFL